ncbi:MAG: Arc family DNA-binding protein [Armatimonadota bacterium]|nr:Arc family DNA-binding protein [Armatimonadota bacterium]
MPKSLSIKNVPDEIVAKLRARARRSHRSLQGELLAILEEAVRLERLSVTELRRRVEALGLSAPDESALLVRADRDAH